jgi:hypothetical protein
MFKQGLFALCLAAAVAGAAQAQNVGVSVNIGEPGFFGRIEIGSAPPPELIYSAPVVIEHVVQPVPPAPVYLHVPPGYERHWRQHCREYNACGVPVFFVRDRWYNDVYVRHYREHRQEYERHDHDGRERERHGDRGEHGDRDDHHDRDRDR